MKHISLYRACINTVNFEFDAYGVTRAKALRALKLTLNAHSRQYRVPTTWVASTLDEANVEMVQAGAGYRDLERLPTQGAHGVDTDDQDMETSDMKECLRSFVDLVSSAGGPVTLALEGAQLGKTVYAVKLSDAVAWATRLLS